MSLDSVDGLPYCHSCNYATCVYGCTEEACYRSRTTDAAVIAALQRTVETLGADVLRLAGELARAVELLVADPMALMTPEEQYAWDKARASFLASFAAPETVK